MQFIQALRAPLLSDSVTAQLTGLLTRRLQFRTGVAGAYGNAGLSADAQEFATYQGEVGVKYALTRNLALGLDYLLYRYEFDSIALLPAGMPRELNRHGIRAYLAMWVPLVNRARRPDAAR